MYSCKTDTQLELPAIISDNMVLQQNSAPVIWGSARTGQEVIVSASWGAEVKTVTDSNGTWRVELTAGEAGGPYYIEIKAGSKIIRIENVMLGEVWLASGQSNMEMPLNGWPPQEPIYGSSEAIAGADYPEIRMFSVVRNMSTVPLSDLEGEWTVSSPETAGLFSATAYFFARKVHLETGFPVGIIHSSWGGTPAESWISGTTLKFDNDFKSSIHQLEEAVAEENLYEEWLSQFSVINIGVSNNIDPLVGIDIYDEYGSSVGTNTDNWQVMNIPNLIENTEVGDFDGVIWFRKTLDIPESWIGQNLILSLGPIDDRDVTWFNGHKVGGMEEDGLWQVDRVYEVPGEYVTDQKVVLAVRMIDTQGGGGIYGKPELLKLFPEGNEAEAISLAGEWQYQIVGEIRGRSLYLFDPTATNFESRPERTVVLNAHTPSVLFNAMIAPLLPYTLKGTIWYQGETNVGRANQYMRLKSMLIADWRNHFKNDDLSFYYVQLAPWHYNDLDGVSSANLREAQRRMQYVPHTGMISTLDIGHLENIHPGNKLDVGERLALWALAKDYSFNIVYSGPEPKEVTINGNKIEIEFEHAESGLILSRENCGQFEIAGADGIFYSAKVTLENDLIIVLSPQVREPLNVRYGYKNGAEASFFNGDMLPAPSFTTENEIID